MIRFLVGLSLAITAIFATFGAVMNGMEEYGPMPCALASTIGGVVGVALGIAMRSSGSAQGEHL